MLIGFTKLLPEMSYSYADLIELSVRIVLSGILGCLIGLERSKRNKEAGPRTHAIIACTAAALVILSKYSFADLPVGALGTKGADPARISAAIVSGVSFLGIGVIFRHGTNVKGLTTAAGIWATAALGMCIGSGFYVIGIVLTLFILLMQTFLHKYPFHHDNYHQQNISVTMQNTDELQNEFRLLLKAHQGEIVDADIRRAGKEEITMNVNVRAMSTITYDEAREFMQKHEGVSRFVV